jgi:large subunit ribosomal protein L13
MKVEKTLTTKPVDITRQHLVVDASGKALGRLASEIAQSLMGKGKPYFSRYMDCGDYVRVINASQVLVTGNKPNKKVYYRHSGYPAGLKTVVMGDVLSRKPEWVILNAVAGMLPKNKLRRGMLKRLEIYPGLPKNS